jgi:gliding motility-associated-like protein
MRSLKIKHILIIVFIMLTALSNAQLVTSTAQSPVQLVEDVLVGGGVDISNVVYTGDVNAIGSFNGTNTNLGLNSGIVLTTGTVLSNSDGPHGPNDTESSGVDNGEPGYQALTDIANEDTKNAAILEFDFVPQSDTIRFRYVFGSEEYPEFVNSGFNDVFAFFISGPGFGGTFNMATIPGTGGTPVTIDNVNDGINSSFYVNNGDGTQAPQNGSSFYIQYDGFTTVIEAVAKVECGEMYHLKVAIADVSDGAFDSGIFLEANSLSSYAPLQMTASSTFNLANNKIAEGCETGTVTLVRSAASASDALTIPITIEGTATEGLDYGNIPDNVSFAPGQTTLSFDFDIFDDGISEGNETLIIKLNYPDPCGNDNFISVDYIIFDVNPLEVIVPDVDVHCSGDESTLSPIITGGINEYSYLWNTGETTVNLTASPVVTTSYTVEVTDVCLTSPVSGTGSINVPVYAPITIVISDDTTVLCPNTPVLLFSEPSGGEGTYSYSWMDNGVNVNNSPIYSASPMQTTNYTLQVTDGCGVIETADLLFTVTTPVLKIEMSPEQTVCPKETTEVSVTASSGLGNYTYYWHHSAETSSSVIVKPENSTNYTVSVEDGCHSYNIDGLTTVNVIRPNANFSLLSNNPMVGLPVYFQNHSTASVAWNWTFDDFETSSSIAPSTVYDVWGWHDVELVAINDIGCTDTVVKTIYIKPEFYFYAPNTFTPDADEFNPVYKVSVIGAKAFDFMIFNRWGDLIYQTDDIYFEWDGTYKGHQSPDGSYVYRVKVTDKEGYIHHHFGTINLLR